MGKINSKTYLSEDLILQIKSFTCYKDLQSLIISKYYERIKKMSYMDSCKLVRYKDNCACIHDNSNYYEAIRILGKNYKKKLSGISISSIEFNSLKSINFAEPYLEVFGEIIHFSCDGKKVYFLDERYRLETYGVPFPSIKLNEENKTPRYNPFRINFSENNLGDKKESNKKKKRYRYKKCESLILSFDQDGNFKIKIKNPKENSKK